MLLVLLVAAAVFAAGVAAARWEHDRQLRALVRAAAAAEQVVADQHTSLYGLYGYTAATLGRTDLTADQRASVLASFSADAARYLPRMAAPRAAAAAVHPLPWDGSLRRARTAVLARMDAWTAQVQAGRTEPDRLLTEPRDTRTERRAAADALDAAGGPDAALAAVTASLRAR